jgi:phosphatidylglycerophosphatase A
VPSASTKKPRFALFVATAAGLGYIPLAPGTWGSLAGAILYTPFVPRVVMQPIDLSDGVASFKIVHVSPWPASCAFALVIALVGVWASHRAAEFSGKKDPQFVVIDEVSGQFLTYLLALAPVNWKYLLLGLILFRVFDIWKPFPVRQAESLPGGWGIMADDWIAAIYAALGLWIARAAGL